MYIDIGGIIDSESIGGSAIETAVFQQSVESLQKLFLHENRLQRGLDLICIISLKPNCKSSFIIYVIGDFDDTTEDALFIEKIFSLLIGTLRRNFSVIDEIECHVFKYKNTGSEVLNQQASQSI